MLVWVLPNHNVNQFSRIHWYRENQLQWYKDVSDWYLISPGMDDITTKQDEKKKKTCSFFVKYITVYMHSLDIDNGMPWGDYHE